MARLKKRFHPRGEDQIKARVAAPAPRPPNVIKKKYLPGSPGANRGAIGVTLTALKRAINEPVLRATVLVDADGNPTGEVHSEQIRVSAICTKHRRKYVRRGL